MQLRPSIGAPSAFSHRLSGRPHPAPARRSLRPPAPIWRAARKQDERARWSAVVPLALEKRLFLNVRPEMPIGATSRQKVLRYQQTAHFVLNLLEIVIRIIGRQSRR